MATTRRALLGASAAAPFLPRAGRAQARPVRLGVLNDQSGPYRDTGGMYSVNCVRQAVADFQAAGGDLGVPIEVIFADHQNKPDVAVGIVRQWFDRGGVDIVLDVPTSSVALAVNTVVREKNKAYVNTGAGTTELTGKQCSPNTIHWSYDTWMLAQSTGGATVRSGGKTWFFVTADYVFGQQLQRDTAAFVTQNGGKVLGSAAYPFPGTTDFSSFLVSAQSSGAKVLGFANAGADTVNCIKQAGEFGLTQSMRLAALLLFIQDVHGLGLQAAQGLVLTESFYWDLNDRTRAFAKRFQARMPGKMPNMTNAGAYAGALHYLKTVKAMGAAAAQADGAATVARMKAMPTDDDAFGPARIREDGLVLLPVFLFEVKKPGESKGPWDYYTLLATTPPDKAWKPLKDEGCPLVRS
ncbi:MAG: ABC transporter substrate-binding protein [Acetobacteraceae bacterium]|nr:ABC transporter substrate-binding protein [Acetobacteraceae bacterium]